MRKTFSSKDRNRIAQLLIFAWSTNIPLSSILIEKRIAHGIGCVPVDAHQNYMIRRRASLFARIAIQTFPVKTFSMLYGQLDCQCNRTISFESTVALR